MNHEKIRDLMITNNFITINDCIPTPLIAVFRNTAFIGNQKNRNKISYLKDEGYNITDTVFLVDNNDILQLMGRSYPHDKYQAQMVAGTAKANYIASAYYFHGFRKGFHLQVYPALRENIKFLVWRSLDMDLKDGDDYTERNNVSDNFHGWAPFSGGCVTVRGKMGKIGHPEDNTEDWGIAYDWIYGRDDTFFNIVIFEHEDLSMDRRLRIGSRGDNVSRMQEQLNNLGFDINPDEDFGPWTHGIVRQFQRLGGLTSDGKSGPIIALGGLIDDGICGPVTARALWE